MKRNSVSSAKLNALYSSVNRLTLYIRKGAICRFKSSAQSEETPMPYVWQNSCGSLGEAKKTRALSMHLSGITILFILLKVGSINYHRNKQQNNVGYVLPSFGFFSIHIATSFGRNARIAPLLADDMYSKIVSKSSKANL